MSPLLRADRGRRGSTRRRRLGRLPNRRRPRSRWTRRPSGDRALLLCRVPVSSRGPPLRRRGIDAVARRASAPLPDRVALGRSLRRRAVRGRADLGHLDGLVAAEEAEEEVGIPKLGLAGVAHSLLWRRATRDAGDAEQDQAVDDSLPHQVPAVGLWCLSLTHRRASGPLLHRTRGDPHYQHRRIACGTSLITQDPPPWFAIAVIRSPCPIRINSSCAAVLDQVIRS